MSERSCNITCVYNSRRAQYTCNTFLTELRKLIIGQYMSDLHNLQSCSMFAQTVQLYNVLLTYPPTLNEPRPAMQ